MDRVSNKWLEDVIRLHELGGIGSELDHAAFCELRDRRAAEQNVTTADLNLGPVTRLRVSDEELCRVGEVFALDSVTNSIICGVPMRHLSLIVDEVIERRAAEREQPAPEPNAWPLGWALVQDGGMVQVVNSYGVALAARAIQIESAPVAPRNVQCHDVADFYKDEEPVEQAAPTEPQPKWERRLAKMKASVRPALDGQGDFVCEVPVSDVFMRVCFGPTAKAAIRKAHKAWEEARGE